MGRRKTIDRDHVLDVAEDIVASRGAGALTIGSVAEAAGITKGGVQSCFGTKEALIAAMLDRWMADDQRRFDAFAGQDASSIERIRAHVEATRSYDDFAQARVSSLLATLLQQPDHIATARRWYEGRVEDLDVGSDRERRARLAFLANEGAFYLRFLGLLPVSSDEWQDIFADIRKLLDAQL
ncbi:TetR/AcrR family transcriptional regulator [Marinivivus vitaminiproducens]|uniref:TetR/AcrR family transcriptional regulator n=1 Tax=Marinivivus vitaminiproducens TaxID=3035935 RepID=UPI0027AA8FAB|nr:TetR family transcriptional regulator [Geminicoccaceae bacterium SCSIO 64248]